MYRNDFSNGVSRCVVLAAFAVFEILSCGAAAAQQSLPTIEVGGGRRAATRGPARRGAGNPAPATQAAAPTSAPQNPGPPSWTSRFPSEPKTPEQGYVVTNASTGTKTNIPIRELPLSVRVVPRQVMVDQNDTNVTQALENVPGVRSNNNELEGYAFSIRGFSTFYIYRNNLAILGGGAKALSIPPISNASRC